MKSLNGVHIPKSVEVIVTNLVAEIEKIKPLIVDGVYLTGSIPLNDFYPRKSDIDFIVLCKYSPEPNIVKQIEELHREIQQQFKRPKLSGVYITHECLKVNNLGTIKVTSVFEGKVNYQDWGNGLTIITLKELKTTALTLLGTPTQDLPIEVNNDDLNRVLFENINSYWLKWLNKHAALHYRYFFLLLFPWLTEWSILGVARQLHTLHTGKITSKLNAGYFALETLPKKYHDIMQRAIEIRKSDDKVIHISPSMKRANETIECVRSIIKEFNRIYNSKSVNG